MAIVSGEGLPLAHRALRVGAPDEHQVHLQRDCFVSVPEARSR